MPTFKPTIRKDKQRPDKTFVVYIRVTHNRATRYINTGMAVSKKELTSSFKIKNQQVLDSCEDIIRGYRKLLVTFGPMLANMDVTSLTERLKMGEQDGTTLSFSDFYNKRFVGWNGETARRYKTAWNSFRKFMGQDNIRFIDVTAKTLKRFEESLNGKQSAQARYPGYIKRVFNDGRFFYNDEDNGVLLIKHSLNSYIPPKVHSERKRALSANQIRQLFSMDYPKVRKLVSADVTCTELSLDCFRLSFCLMGTNAVDLYNATEYDGNTLVYERQKVRNRRTDRARIEIVVPDIVKPLFEKYKGKKGKVFDFSERYTSSHTFSIQLNYGIKKVGKDIGVPDLTFYAARHSMATIAYNDVGIAKDMVNDMLNHIAPSMAITEVYIKKSFKPINEANAKLLEYMFGNSEKKE